MLCLLIVHLLNLGQLLSTVPPLNTPKAAETPPAGAPYAWYREDGLDAEGPDVSVWRSAEGTAANRTLDRIVGRPRLLRVNAAFGAASVLRLDGQSAVWQAVSAWGTLKSPVTVIVFARLNRERPGVLFDGSTRVGSLPARWESGRFSVASSEVMISKEASWRAYAFPFSENSGPLGGFILGANVAAKDGLECDIAEVLIYPRALSAEECRQTIDWLTAKWGQPEELPAKDQPRPLQAPTDPRLFRMTLRRRGDDGVDTYRIPGLAATPSGTLIAVFDARNKNGGDLPGDIDVAMQRSTDGGNTWSSLQRIMDFDAAVSNSHGNGVGDPAVLVDRRTGNILVAALWSKGPRGWNGSGPGMTPEETGQLMLVRSTDDGLTWSQPISLTPQLKQPGWRLCFNGPGNGIQLRNGTLVFPAQFRDEQGKPHSCFIASTDGGEKWTISPPAISNGVPTSECAIAELQDGSLLLSMRNEARSGRRAWARWEWQEQVQQGRWSQSWLDVPDPTCMASLIRHPDGPLLFSNPNHTQQRRSLTVRYSTDSGHSWSRGKLLDPAGAMYSCMATLPDGEIALLYESAAAEGLVFLRFPLAWVLEI
jgi:sialidase-1